jgi:hypothetical protein
MKSCCASVFFLLSLALVVPASGQTNAHPVLTVPATGTFHGGGNFSGTISINRFEQRDTKVVAIGFVSGVLTRANQSLGTAVAGEIAWPVAIKSGGMIVARGPQRAKAVATLAAFRPEPAATPRFILAQSTPPCPVLDVALGPVTVNLLGAQVALGAVSFDLSGQTGPLGDLVCAASDLLGNVAGVVNLLNSVLGLVTGLVGGLTGGLGGVVPMP